MIIAFWKTHSHKLPVLHGNEFLLTFRDNLEMMIVELNKAIFTNFVSYKAERYNFLWDPSLPTSSTNQGLYQDTKRLISSLSLLFQHLPLLYFSNFSFWQSLIWPRLALNLKYLILLYSCPKCWDYRHVPTSLE